MTRVLPEPNLRQVGELHPESFGSRPHCDHCGDVIGVYEPLVLVSTGKPNETSLAANPDLSCAEACYHVACYALRSTPDGR